MKHYKKFIFAATFFLSHFSPTCFATLNSSPSYKGDSISLSYGHPLRWLTIVTLSGGIAGTHEVGESQAFTWGNIQYGYHPTGSTQVQGVWGGFVGVEFEVTPDWFLQTGLSYHQTSFSASGALTRGPFDTLPYFNYHYNILARQVLVDSKLLLNWNALYHPYLSVGIGAVINKSKSYQDNLPVLIFSPVYSNHTQTDFSYSLGVGVDYDIPQGWRIGAGYRFVDLGKPALGTGHVGAYSVGSSLSQNKILYANELLLEVTYIL